MKERTEGGRGGCGAQVRPPRLAAQLHSAVLPALPSPTAHLARAAARQWRPAAGNAACSAHRQTAGVRVRNAGAGACAGSMAPGRLRWEGGVASAGGHGPDVATVATPKRRKKKKKGKRGGGDSASPPNPSRSPQSLAWLGSSATEEATASAWPPSPPVGVTLPAGAADTPVVSSPPAVKVWPNSFTRLMSTRYAHRW